jgi:hypothetical protein
MNLLTPMIIKEKDQLVFMDFNEMKVYEILIKDSKLFLSQIDHKTSEECFEDVQEQQKTMNPDLPLEEIFEVMRTEKDLSEQNSKHIFRREA